MKPKSQVAIMKKNFFYLYLLIIVALTSSCAGTRDMQVQVKRPALITIDKNIQSISILNRSIPTEKMPLEGIITGEKPLQDKELSEECIRGLNETLNTSNRFRVTRCGTTMNASDPKSLSIGMPLDWTIIDSICTADSTQAILVLEFFDTDFSVLNPGATAANAIGGLVNGTSSTVQVQGTAKAFAGFRVYYPKTKSILYEDRFNYKKNWSQQSTNPADAIAKLIKKNAALFDVSYATGYEFAMNIVPLYFWEHRDMYKGKKGLLQIGERKALAKDWEGAVKTWNEAYENEQKSKTKAKAAFNLALGYEVMGDLNEAQRWIQIAYVEGGKKVALHYSDILDARIREQNKLKEQTN